MSAPTTNYQLITTGADLNTVFTAYSGGAKAAQTGMKVINNSNGWVQTFSSGSNFTSSTVSADGQKIAACQNPGYIYTSVDGGLNWTQQTAPGSKQWASITSSSDGTIIGACANNFVVSGSNEAVVYIYRNGAWNNGLPVLIGDSNMRSITCTSDGNQFYGALNFSTDTVKIFRYTWISNTYNVNNSNTNIPKNVSSITCSSDGTKLAVCVQNDYIYTTTDNSLLIWTKQYDSGIPDWRSITSNTTGQYLAACAYNNYIYTSSDYGVNWSPQAQSEQWVSISCDSSGQQITSCTQNGQIWQSTDYGINWVQIGTNVGTPSWTSVSTSGSGNNLVATVSSGNIYNTSSVFDLADIFAPYVSGNKAEPVGYNILNNFHTFTPTTLAQKNRTYVTSSGDGIKFAACTGGESGNYGYIYISNDSGQIWTQVPSSSGIIWQSISSSSNGSVIAAAPFGDYIYFSTDSGTSWNYINNLPSVIFYSSVTVSADGTKLAACCPKVGAGETPFVYTSTTPFTTLVQSSSPNQNWSSITNWNNCNGLAACVSSGNIYISSDFGTTWSGPLATTQNWSGISASSSGSVLAACVDGGFIYISNSTGATWTQVASSLGWKTIKVSEDGSRIAAGVSTGYIYYSNAPFAVWTQVATNLNWLSISMSSNGSQIVASAEVNYIYTSQYFTKDISEIFAPFLPFSVTGFTYGIGYNYTFLNNYYTLTFLASSTGSITFNVAIQNLQVLVVGGGGSGFAATLGQNGGGGAGGCINYQSGLSLTPGNYAITVGSGGNNSVFSTYTAAAGAQGSTSGGTGANGGGSGGNPGSSAGTAGNPGTQITIGQNPATYYSGGGGGGGQNVGTNGGNRGGGAGGYLSGSAGPGTPNTGGGGGGGGNGNQSPGAGGSGIVILYFN